MRKRVRVTAGSRPPKYYDAVCPHCSRDGWRVLNGGWLRWMREQAGIDQRTLAKRLQISGPYLSDIETNRRHCPAYVLMEYENLKLKLRESPVKG